MPQPRREITRIGHQPVLARTGKPLSAPRARRGGRGRRKSRVMSRGVSLVAAHVGRACPSFATTASGRRRFLFERFIGDSSRPLGPRRSLIRGGPVQRTPVTGLRLPTEAELEYAYRAGTTTAFHSFPGYANGTNDDTLLGNIAWKSGNNGDPGSATYGTKPVGGKFANALGLHDMSGNVWEWCQDWDGSYSSAAQTNPTGPATGSSPVLRGGNWNENSYYCRASGRYSTSPDSTYYLFGFRVAKTP